MAHEWWHIDPDLFPDIPGPWDDWAREVWNEFGPDNPPPDGGPPSNGAPGTTAPAPGGAPMEQQNCGPKPVYKWHCGAYRWVYPKRRRRKQLVTKSDIKGLAALKGVLGNGKAMESWIATHS